MAGAELITRIERVRGSALCPRGPHSEAARAKVSDVIGGARGLTSSRWEAEESYAALELGTARLVFSTTLYQALHWGHDVGSGRQGLCLEGALSSRGPAGMTHL